MNEPCALQKLELQWLQDFLRLKDKDETMRMFGIV
jgi:hypothetical protein